jgi:hypothetical protein
MSVRVAESNASSKIVREGKEVEGLLHQVCLVNLCGQVTSSVGGSKRRLCPVNRCERPTRLDTKGIPQREKYVRLIGNHR